MITTWVLILTLTKYNVAAITSVPGFATQQECAIAGDAWLKNGHNSILTLRALCVVQSSPPQPAKPKVML